MSTILPIFLLVGGIFFIVIYWKYQKNMLAFREIQKSTMKFNFFFFLALLFASFLFELLTYQSAIIAQFF
jgi:hypothetical protein